MVAAAAFLLAFSAPVAAHALTRAEVARHWAPIVYQEVFDASDPTDFFTAYDFDHDWNGDDNGENDRCWSDPAQCTTADNSGGACANQACPLIATVYYVVLETPTHWFVNYMPYHPLDTKVTNGHEHDTENVLFVIAKSGGNDQYGKVQAMEVQFHGTYYQYGGDIAVNDGADNIDGPIKLDTATGRPAIYSQMVGHGLCGGFSPPNYQFPDLQLTCDHNADPHIDKTGVVYSPGAPTTTPAVVANQAVKAEYLLLDLATSVWPHIHEIGAGKAFQSAVDYTGERCPLADGGIPAAPDGGPGQAFQCPKGFGGPWEGNEGQSPSEPWNQSGGNGVSATGDQFFDPAYTMSKRLSFPAPYALEYCFNPYLGVTTGPGCLPPDPGDAGAGSEAGVTEQDAGSPADDFDAGARDDAGRVAAANGASSGGGCGCAIVDAASSGGAGAAAAGGAAFAIGLALRVRRRSRRSRHRRGS